MMAKRRDIDQGGVRRTFALSLDTKVLYDRREGGGWYAIVDVLGTKRIIGCGTTRGKAFEDLTEKLEKSLADIFW